MPNSIENKIKQKALHLGFLSCGIARAEPLNEFKPLLTDYIESKRNASLAYMERNVEKRINPQELVEGCQSVISVTLNYFTTKKQVHPDAPVLSKYAYGTDYHIVVKEKLHELLNYIKQEDESCQGRAFVDSAPVAEKLWAQKAGLGWLGKNSLLITPENGSFVFIGELLVNLELKPDKPLLRDKCGNCTLCIEACPTQAILSAGKIDVSRCISYHTTANKLPEIDAGFKGRFKNRVFGCDICQDVCPHNKKAKEHSCSKLNANNDILQMSKEDWYKLNKERFKQLFSNNAASYIKHLGMQRNIHFLQ